MTSSLANISEHFSSSFFLLVCAGMYCLTTSYTSVIGLGLVYGYCVTTTYAFVIGLGLVYGSSNGIYLAVDYALAVDCLPNKQDCAYGRHAGRVRRLLWTSVESIPGGSSRL
ncbi:hypothetical protein T484DRAFT_1833879 [Baffinella frigidus]|nr:hypothetical protein T484DRAFT_1833879 [Cryptophyta sp. CCMP2293]